MIKKKYSTPFLMISSGGDGSETGQGSGQGTVAPQGMTYDEWWDEIAWGGENPDADYNGDGSVDQLDYQYYMDNELWNG